MIWAQSWVDVGLNLAPWVGFALVIFALGWAAR